MVERVLDRLVEFDDRSRGYTIREHLQTVRRAEGLRRIMVRPGPTLDQGREGACVGFSGEHFLNATPAAQKPAGDNMAAFRRYKECQRNDQWPGENYDGTSVIALMRVLRAQGKISGYRWVGAGSQQLEDDVVDTLRFVGPIVLGVPWYGSMFEPRPNGLVEVDTSDLAGGHALLAINFARKRLAGEAKAQDLVRLQNSWGVNYGTKYFRQGGFIYITLDDLLNKLLANDGEGAVPFKLTGAQ